MKCSLISLQNIYLNYNIGKFLDFMPVNGKIYTEHTNSCHSLPPPFIRQPKNVFLVIPSPAENLWFSPSTQKCVDKTTAVHDRIFYELNLEGFIFHISNQNS